MRKSANNCCIRYPSRPRRLSVIPPKTIFESMYSRFLKRPLDFCCALAAILALSPLLPKRFAPTRIRFNLGMGS